jgi:hypothetical protein
MMGIQNSPRHIVLEMTGAVGMVHFNITRLVVAEEAGKVGL